MIVYHWSRWVAVLVILGLSLATGLGPILAQEDGAVQVLTGRIEPGEIILYLLPGLQQGQRLYVYAKGTSGNLDPAVGVVDAGVDPEALELEFEAALDEIVTAGADPLEALEEVRDQFMLASDDDSGGGLTAALEFEVPADGDYRLLVTGAVSVLGRQTFGDYRLSIGLDAARVLKGDAEPTGDTVAVLDVEATPLGVGVQEITGSLTEDKRSTFVALHNFKPSDTLYAYIEATSGDLIPTIVLENFAGKPIRSGNLNGNDTKSSLQYTFPVEGHNYKIEIESCCGDEQITSGDYRLLVGVNAPEVLTGEAELESRAVVRDPIEVKVGIKVEQIIKVDHRAEFFTAVVSLQMEWTDPALAFNPETCHCEVKNIIGRNVDRFIADKEGTWPEFSLENQQGSRQVQNQVLTVFADGRVVYFEHFTANFRVDFDFRQYPFDVQEFLVQVDSLFPEEFCVYAELEGFSELSMEHGEDEFILTEPVTSVTSRKTNDGSVASRFTFRLEGPRHLVYFVFHIFVPILLIIMVSYVTFFLKDYGRRIQIASGNLVLFIFFSLSLASDYPRLGYLTFLDVMMAIMFVVNAFLVIYNVWLSWLEVNEKGELAGRVDSVMDWFYPMMYIVAFGVITWSFF